MIDARPGERVSAVLDEAPAGLVGTVAVRLIDENGITVMARTTAGIIEPVTGSGMYLARFLAPEEPGSYTVFWDNGTVSRDTTTTEDLIVAATSATNARPGGAVTPTGSVFAPTLGGSYLGAGFIGGIETGVPEGGPPAGVTGLVDSSVEEFIAKQGDSGSAWVDQLSYSNGEPADLTGCSVALMVRSLRSRAPLELTSRVTIAAPTDGVVEYTPSKLDTAIFGDYMAVWVVTYPAGEQLTFPTDGYRTIRVEENLTASTAQQLVTLGEVKEHLGIEPENRAHDTKLLDWVAAAAPLIESITGPVLQQEFEEWFDGGDDIIALGHRPNRGPGTSPVLRLIGVWEYRANIEYPLDIIPSPVEGSMYSVFLNERDGSITRRVSGGGTIPFYPGRESIKVIYQAGQEQVPAHVRRACLEAIRINYRSTQSTGKGKRAEADSLETGAPSLGFFLPGRCKELLSPSRRHPSIT